MCVAEISNPFMRHPLMPPRFVTRYSVVSVAQRSDSEVGVIGENVPRITFEERVESKPFVEGVCNKYVNKG